MSECHGNGEDHCCYVNGQVCPFLVENAMGRRWACGLRIELGSWDEVHRDPRYLEKVKPVWTRFNVDDCGDWQAEGQCCFAEEGTPVTIHG